MFDLDQNFLYDGIQYTCSYDYCCQDYGCYEEGICRCSTIDSVDVHNINAEQLLLKIIDDEYDDLTLYCLERIVQRTLSPNSFQEHTSGGYYGDELDSVTMLAYTQWKLERLFIDLLDLETSEEKINFILHYEYNYICKSLQDKTFRVVAVDTSSIKITNKKQLNLCKKEIKHRERPYDFTRAIVPIGIATRRGCEYILVDGYHRYEENKHNDIVKIIIGE